MKAVLLVFQVVLSLGVVLLLMWVLARALRGTMLAKGAGVVELLARAPMTRGSSVAVVRVADRVLVLGVTETQITVLTEAGPEQIRAATQVSTGTPGPARTIGRLLSPRFVRDGAGPLAGSVLSVDSWRRALAVLRERTVRR
jgi:flagellar protein FliO/FliZ